MTIFEFNTLGKPEQIATTLNLGVHISTCRETIYEIMLYQLESFYVEFYLSLIEHGVKKIHSFSSTNNLDKYLEKIDITEVIQEG